MSLFTLLKGIQLYNKKTRFTFFISKSISDDVKKVILHNYNKKEYEENIELSKECKNYIDLKNKIFYEFFPNEKIPVPRKGCNKHTSPLLPQENEGRNLLKEVEYKPNNQVNERCVKLSVSYVSEYRKMKKAAKKNDSDNCKKLSVKETVPAVNRETHGQNVKTFGERDNERKYFGDSSHIHITGDTGCGINTDIGNDISNDIGNDNSNDNMNDVSNDISDDLRNILIDNRKAFYYLDEKKEMKKMKLSQGCSHLGFCSSRFAIENFKNGIVTVNGCIVFENIDIDLDKDKIELTKRGKELLKNKITIIINKPPNYLSISTDDKSNKLLIRKLIKNENKYIEEEHKCMSYFIYKNVNIEKVNNLYVCGRLDRSSSGLLIYTQNTLTHNHLLNKYKFEIEKEYIITTYYPITEQNLKMLRTNLCIDGKYIYRCQITYVNKYTLRFIIYQGFHKIIRKMALLSNIKIKSLHRVRIGNIHIKNLPMGKWRFLMPNESFI